MKTFLVLSFLLLVIQTATATHLRGGSIQVKRIPNSALTYEITVVLNMDEVRGAAASSVATSISICFGDGQTGEAARLSRVLTSDKLYSFNTYRIVHTYSGPGPYNVAVSMTNRTVVNNIDNADFQFFSLNTLFSTNIATQNQTPTPVWPENGLRIGVNQRTSIALKATDADGDSLVYGLAKVLTNASNGGCSLQPVSSYKFPNGVMQRGTFKIDSRTGELIWDAPTQLGNYSAAIVIYEYRKGILISQTTQEITLLVEDKAGPPSTIPAYEPAFEGAIITAIPEFPATDVTLNVFPNPVDDRLQVVIQTNSPATATIQLIDNSGRSIHELRFRKAARQHEQVISMDSLSPGIYVLRADIGGRSVVRKIMKK